MSNARVNDQLTQMRSNRAVSNRTIDDLRLLEARIIREKESEAEAHKTKVDGLLQEIQQLNDHHEAQVSEANYSLSVVKKALRDFDRQDEVMNAVNNVKPKPDAMQVARDIAAQVEAEEAHDTTPDAPTPDDGGRGNND